MRRGRVLVSVLMASVLLLAGCGGDRIDSLPSPSSTPTPTGSASGSASPSTENPSPSTASPSPSTTVDPSPSATGCAVPARYAGADLERLPLTDEQIALTFDAGSSAAGVPSILRTLSREQVPATFFLTGDFVRTYPGQAARIGRRHLVGNHTDSHPDLTQLRADQVEGELRHAQATILRVTGQDPRRYFRFPFGARDVRTISIVNQRCYVAFRWTVDTLGWKGTSGGVTVETVVQRVLDAAAPGSIVLMHVGAHPDDGSTVDADALPTLIRRLQALGYTFVDLSAALPASP